MLVWFAFSETAEKRVERAFEFGEEKYKATVKSANERIDRVLEEKRQAEEEAKELDEECDELVAKLNVTIAYDIHHCLALTHSNLIFS